MGFPAVGTGTDVNLNKFREMVEVQGKPGMMQSQTAQHYLATEQQLVWGPLSGMTRVKCPS